MADATRNETLPRPSVEAPAELAAPPATWRRLGFGFWLAVGWLALVTILALLAPWLPLADPDQTAVGGRLQEAAFTWNGWLPELSIDRILQGPTEGLWFGADATGRDVFSLTVWGARISLLVGVIAIVVGFLVGGSIGMLAGYFRGWFDRIVSFLFATLLSFPALILAILITTLLGRTVFWVALSIGILAIAPVGRLARAQTLVFAEKDFVMASRILGAKDSRIILRDLLPNVVIPMSALALLGMGIAIVAEGTLAFLGISVEGGLSWGTQIFASAQRSTDLKAGPHAALFPIAATFLTVLALNYAGDRLREVFDAKELAF